jgi:hypothetical protein
MGIQKGRQDCTRPLAATKCSPLYSGTVPLEILVGLRVILSGLLDNVLTHVRIVLFDVSGDLEMVFGWHLHRLRRCALALA